MIFRPIDYDVDKYGVEAAHLVFSEVMGDKQVQPNARSLYKSMTFGMDNYCLEDELAPGLVGVGSLDLADIDKGVAKIENVAIRPNYRGEGLGRFLIGSLEDKSRELGASIVRLSSLESAEPFYLRLGYQLVCDNKPYDLAKPL